MSSGVVVVPGGAVILHGPALDLAVYAVRLAQQARARNGLPSSIGLEQLAAVLAAPGQSASPPAAVAEHDLMTIHEAAEALGVSERTARRLAPQLGGRLVGGRWLLDRQCVAEHISGSDS